MEFRPCIDLRNGNVVQIVGGTLSDDHQSSVVTNFKSEKGAAYFADKYKQDGLVGGHVIALGPGNEEAALSALRAYPQGLQYGGGVTPDNALRYLEAGASHVIVTSYIFVDGDLSLRRLNEMVELVGKERLVLDLSCRQKDGEYWVVMDRWQTFTKFKISETVLRDLSSYCDEFLVHGVDVEGLQAGIEVDLVEKLALWSPIPVTYAGGVRSFEDIKTIKKCGKDRIHFTIGSALDIFGGTLRYNDIIKEHKENFRNL